jgi:membrane protease YdiL (CAAX protease family)
MSDQQPQSGDQYPGGEVPPSVGGAFYSIGLVILLTIVTCGIWSILWSYRTNEDLKKYNRDGLGGVLGVVICILLAVVLMFTIPNEIKNMYERDGRESPVNPLWGLWFLLPIIGNIIWYVKVQGALNDFWVSKGAALEA